MNDIHIATHGERGPKGSIGGKMTLQRVAMGHSHNPTPPFWRRMWLRLRGEWPPKPIVVVGARLPFPGAFNYNPMPRPENLKFSAKLIIEDNEQLQRFVAGVHKAAYEDAVINATLFALWQAPPAAVRVDNGEIVFDSWYWTGRDLDAERRNSFNLTLLGLAFMVLVLQGPRFVLHSFVEWIKK